MQGSNGETDIENRLMDMGRGEARGKGDVSVKGEGCRNLATAACPLRAISLKIISKWARPILG